MPVYAVWESHFPPEATQQGRAITEAIWRDDMPKYDGYLAHELIEDLDDPGHLLVVRKWSTRQRADEALREYANHPNARRANELVSRPRRRCVGQVVGGGV
jgi:hypothetical protein